MDPIAEIVEQNIVYDSFVIGAGDMLAARVDAVVTAPGWVLKAIVVDERAIDLRMDTVPEAKACFGIMNDHIDELVPVATRFIIHNDSRASTRHFQVVTRAAGV